MRQFLLLCAALAFAAVGARAPASADEPDYTSLAKAITNGFFTNEGASAGNDWCYQIESDPNETVWDFKASDGWAYPHIIDYAVRIRLTFPAVDASLNPIYYVNSGNKYRVTDAGSLLMGFDLMKSQSYNNNDISVLKEYEENKYKDVKKPQYVAPPKSVTPSGTVIIPNNSSNTCPKFEAMLGSIFRRYLTGWVVPQGENPSCDDLAGNCPYIPVPNPGGGGTATNYISRQTSIDNIATFSTWTFNGQTHKIPRAIRFLIINNGAPAYFNIGFGGSGGAG